MVRADKTKAVRIIDHFVLGGFLVCENPFSAAHQLQLRVRFNALDSRVSQAWSRTVMAMPGAIIAALAAGPIADGQAIIVFMTEDLDGLLERVQANGGRVTEEQTIPEHGYKLAFWRDPEGNLIESAQRI